MARPRETPAIEWSPSSDEGPGPSRRSRAGRRPVLADVARVAGTSLQTASRVLRGHRGHAESTRRRVFAAAALLGYEVDDAARALALRRGQAQPQTRGDQHDPTCDVVLLGHLAARLLQKDAAHVQLLGGVLQEVMAACDVLMASCDCTTAPATD